MKRALQILFGTFLFIFPFSIRFLVYDQNSYRFGNFNPWVSGFVYLPELLLLATFVLWAVHKFKARESMPFRNTTLWILFGLFAVNGFLVTLVSGDPVMAAFFILRLFEGVIVFWLLTDKVLSAHRAITVLLLGAFLQIVWGFAQWKLNHSLGLSLLGESHLGAQVLGVAKIDLPDGLKQIRAYGSFLHANILAAYLLIIGFISLRYLRRKSALLWITLFILGLYFAHSRAAALIGVGGLILYYLFLKFKALSFQKSVVLALGSFLVVANLWFFMNHSLVKFKDASWAERLEQIGISETLFKQNPAGVGVSNFTLAVETASPRKLSPWEFQPVHNTYFLILGETGFQGLMFMALFLSLLFWKVWKYANPVPILSLIFLAPLDHYLWDSFAGLILVALVAGFFQLENEAK